MSWFSNLFKKKTSRPPAPTPRRSATLAIWARDEETKEGIARAFVDVVDPRYPMPVEGQTNDDGYFPLPDPVEYGRYTVEVHADGYGSVEKFVDVTGNHDEEFLLPSLAPPKQVVDMRPARAVGRLLLLPDNTPFNIKFVTAFDAGRLVYRKEFGQLRDYAKWTRDTGGNGWRVFVAGWSRTGFDYRNIPDYYTRVLPDLNMFMSDEGLRGEAVCVCDGIPHELNEQNDLINKVMDVLAMFWLVEEANEPWKNEYDPQLHTFNWPGRLMAKGAPPAGTSPYPYIPSRGYNTHHSPRTEDWARKCGKDSYEIYNETHALTYGNEPPGFAEDEKPGSRVNNARHAFAAGVGSRMFGPGGLAHGDTNTMQLCKIPGRIETFCTKRFFQGIDFVPAQAPNWTYARYGPSNPGVPMPIEDDLGPGKLTDHMHAMIGPNLAVVCNYYPSPGWYPKPINGWRIINYDDCAVLLER